MWREPKPFAGLHEHGELELGREILGQPARRRRDSERLEGLVGEVLVAHLLRHVRRRQEERCAELVTCAGEDQLVEIGERDDEVDAVLGDELRELRDVARIVDADDELVAVGVVERRRERVDVDGNGRRAGPAEGRDDVDALPCAGEEDRGHGERG